MDEYTTLEEYFKDHPDEEEEYIEYLAEQANVDETIDYPEEWEYVYT